MTTITETEYDKALSDLIAAVSRFAEVFMSDINKESVAAIQKAVDQGNSTFVTQIETSYRKPSKVMVSLKVPHATEGIQLIPLCAVEGDVPTLQ